MAALTYTARKYKYFTLSIEYKFAASGNPWPIVTFNQQNTIPEMFYSTVGNTTNPTYSEDPIAVTPNYAGNIRIYGKKASGSMAIAAQMDTDSSPQWHKMKITVTPGKVYAVVYKADGSVGVEYTTTLSNDYKGGYITLMQNGVSHFKNISISKVDYEGDFTSKLNKIDTPGKYKLGIKITPFYPTNYFFNTFFFGSSLLPQFSIEVFAFSYLS